MSKLDIIKKIDMDNGSFPYARDIGKVLAKTRMNNSHRGVIDAVIDKTFGWPDNKSEKKEKIKKRKTKEKISFAFFQEYTGSPISKLSTTIKDLTNWNVLKKTKQGRTYIYSFNQIVEEWDRRIFKKIFQKQGWGMVYQSGNFTNQETLPIREPLVYQSVNLQFTNQESISAVSPNQIISSEHLNNSLNNSLNKKHISSEFIPTLVELALTKFLFKLIKKRKPNFTVPDFAKWAKHIHDLIVGSKSYPKRGMAPRTPKQIAKVIWWCQNDVTPNKKGFCWANNILSTRSLREKFDTLEIRMQEEEKRCQQRQPPLRRPLGGRPWDGYKTHSTIT